MTPLLRIAAAQFPVSGNIVRNVRYIQAQMQAAAAKGVQVIHFPETALSGYGPAHVESFNNYAWDLLEDHTRVICALAGSLNLWVILGTTRPIDGQKPRNCVHVIANTGVMVGSYDKQRLYRREKDYYSPGYEPLVVPIHGVTCGFLICYDNCYPALYEDYRNRGVELLFHSFHNAGNRHVTRIKDLMRAILMTRAADHQMWISASNSSTRYSPLPACIVRPDGSMVSSRRHAAGMVVEDYPNAELGWTYDNRTI